MKLKTNHKQGSIFRLIVMLLLAFVALLIMHKLKKAQQNPPQEWQQILELE